MSAHTADRWIVSSHVVSVSDGDTITVLDRAKVQHKVRLSGIDAPEKGQAFEGRAKDGLARFVFDREVKTVCHKRDRYGREVCRVFVGSQDAALAQLRAGLAWHYKRFEGEQPVEQRARDSAAEEEARARRVGLWSDPRPVPPWEWRGSAVRPK